MTSDYKKRVLTGNARLAVLELAKRSTGKLYPASSPDQQKYKSAASFSELNGYQEVRKMRAAGDMLKIGNPFFRAHDGRASATTFINGEEYANYASYDYLGLNNDPRVGEAAIEAIQQYGTSASASRVVAGERPIHGQLEKALAEHYGVEDAAVFVSGHATNVGTIGYLLDGKDLVIHDSYVHNSVLVGTKLSGASRRSFEHNNLDMLVTLLEENRNKYKNVLIAVEGLYSMDGDTANISRLIEIKEHFGAWLMVDEAHSLGVTGRTGYGSREKYDIDPTRVDIWMGTLSKTLGAAGGYIAGSSALVDLLKTQVPGFVYSVGLSPALAAAAKRSLSLVHEEPERVEKMQSNGKFFLDTALELGFDTGFSEGYAVTPLMIGDSLVAAKLTNRLFVRNINVMPIIYPAVPMKSARLRFFITSEHSQEQLKSTLEIVREELDQIAH